MLDLEAAAHVLGVDLAEAEDLCAAVGADPERLTIDDLLEMATCRDEELDDADEDEEFE